MFFELLSLLLLPIAPLSNEVSYSTDLQIEDHTLVEVLDKDALEVRIYKESGVTSIASLAFDGCQFESLMISSSVRSVNADYPVSLLTINYTGSLDDINFDIPNNIAVNEYACDEGFLNFWANYIRPDIDGTICNVNKDNYLKMKQLYLNLSNDDKSVINDKEDGDGTIKDSIEFLDSHFASPSGTKTKEKEISQKSMLTLILVIASFGMTSIGVFYFLKDKQVIK